MGQRTLQVNPRPVRRPVELVDTYARDESTVPREAERKRREPWPRQIANARGPNARPKPPPLPPRMPSPPPPPPPPGVVLTSGSPSATTEVRRVPRSKSKTKWALVVVAVFAGVFWWRLEQSTIVPNAMDKAPSVVAFAKSASSMIASESAAAPPPPPPPPIESAAAAPPAPPPFSETTSPLLGTIRVPAGTLNMQTILPPAPIGAELALPGAPPLPHPLPVPTTGSFGPAVITPAWHAPKTPHHQKPHAHLKAKTRPHVEPEPASTTDGLNEKLDSVLRQARRD